MSDLLKALGQEIGAMVLQELRLQRNGEEWVDQFRSPLCLPGQEHSRRHCGIVKRRIRNGLPGAYISPDGKQFFLTTSALAEECRGAASAPAAAAKAAAGEGDDGYDGMMRLIRGGGQRG